MTSPLPIEVDCATVHQKLTDKADFKFIDCREASEYATCQIAGAELWPMSGLAARLAELEPHRNREVIIHCHHGGRSLRVANWLRQNGFPNARSMAGGIDQWSTDIDPTVPRY